MNCTITRLIKPEETMSSSLLLEKLDNVSKAYNSFKTYVVVDDFSESILLTLYLLRRCNDLRMTAHRIGLPVFLRIVLLLAKLKDLQNKIKMIEEKFKRNMGSMKEYEKYQELLSSREEILPRIASFWEKHPDDFNYLYQCILSIETDLEEAVKYVILTINKYDEETVWLRNCIIRNTGLQGYNILWIRDLISSIDKLSLENLSIVSKFKLLVTYLKRLGCNKIFIVDGSEYSVLASLLNRSDVVVV